MNVVNGDCGYVYGFDGNTLYVWFWEKDACYTIPSLFIGMNTYKVMLQGLEPCCNGCFPLFACRKDLGI